MNQEPLPGPAPERAPYPADAAAQSLSAGGDRPGRRRLDSWIPVLAVLGVCLALVLGGEPVRRWARYDRAGIQAGQLWRLVTGHLVHLNAGHFLLDGTALVLIRLIVGDALSAAAWCGAGLASMAAIDAGLYFGSPGVLWYVGLSGMLHGLLAAGALALLERHRRFALTIAAGIAGKLVWEHFLGPLPFSESATGGVVITAAHLYGAVGGTLFGAALALVRRRGPASL